MYRLRNPIKEYAWGSRTAIASFLGRPTPSAKPQAELWMGGHPSASSTLVMPDGTGEALNRRIALAPEKTLGAAALGRFGPRLPFLLKVLAAEQPLSLQAHPNARQARLGFEAEEAAGVPIDAVHRLYKDASHKPELICAMTPFEALCGFRPPSETRAFFAEIGVGRLRSMAEALGRGKPGDALREVFEALVRVDESDRAALIGAVAEGCDRASTVSSRFAREHAWAVRLATMYPTDAGVVMALMLNLVELRPWDAVYLGACELHAYLHGVGIEVMANSDNVLRGGLTEKHVDVPELLRTLTFEPCMPVPVATTTCSDGEIVYLTDSAEFRLSRIEVDRSRLFRPNERSGPEILLAIEGSLRVTSGPHLAELTGGESVFISADLPQYAIEGGGKLVRATTGDIESAGTESAGTESAG
ncbi:MAG: mannose-6-phosphate isomerase, class I [Polyangiaceae bacterium]|jgi:mannose-6-phosphate isomerase